MTSIITRAASAIASAWRSHERKRLERRALLTIINRKNDHLRRDVGLAAGDDFLRTEPAEPGTPASAAASTRKPEPVSGKRHTQIL